MRYLLFSSLLLLAGCSIPPESTPPPPYRPTPVPELPAFGYAEADVKPVLLRSWDAVDDNTRYPEMARRAGITGTVHLRFVVTAEGDVADLRVVRGIGGGSDEAAIEGLRDERFTPGEVDGEPENVRMEAVARFDLPGATITYAPGIQGPTHRP